MGCTSKCAKYFLCFFNFAFFIAGGAALAVGVWLIADKNSFTNFISQIDEAGVLRKTDAETLKMISYILIVAGALTFFVSFLGYCGAMFESRCLLCLYGFLILIVLVLECIVVGLAFELKGHDGNKLEDFVKDNFKDHYGSKQTARIAWDQIMSEFKCCGVENYSDFSKVKDWPHDKQVPEACCIKSADGYPIDSNCQRDPSPFNSYHQKGCYSTLVNAIENNIELIIGVGAGLIFVEVLLIIMALYLACCHWRPQHGRLGVKVNY